MEEDRTDSLTHGEMESWIHKEKEKIIKRKKRDDLHKSAMKKTLPDVLPLLKLGERSSTSSSVLDDHVDLLEFEDIYLESLLDMPEEEFLAALHSITLVSTDKPSGKPATIDQFAEMKTVMGEPQQPSADDVQPDFFTSDGFFQKSTADPRMAGRRELLAPILSKESLGQSEHSVEEVTPLRTSAPIEDDGVKIKDDLGMDLAELGEFIKRELHIKHRTQETESPFNKMTISQQTKRDEPETKSTGLIISHQMAEDANLVDFQIKQQKKSLLYQQEEIITKYNNLVKKQEELVLVQQSVIKAKEKNLLGHDQPTPAQQAELAEQLPAEQKANMVARQREMEFAQRKMEIVRQRELILMKQKQLDMQYKELIMKQTALLTSKLSYHKIQKQDRLLTRQKEIIARQMELLLQQQKELDKEYNDLINQEYDIETELEVGSKDPLRQAIELISQELARRNELERKGKQGSIHDLKKLKSESSGIDIASKQKKRGLDDQKDDKQKEISEKKKRGGKGKKEDAGTTQKDIEQKTKVSGIQKSELVSSQPESDKVSVDSLKEESLKYEESDSRKRSAKSENDDIVSTQKPLTESLRKSDDSQKEDALSDKGVVLDSRKKTLDGKKKDAVKKKMEISDTGGKIMDGQEEDLALKEREILESQKKISKIQKEDHVAKQKESRDSKKMGADGQKDDLEATQEHLSDSKKSSVASKKGELVTTQEDRADSATKSIDTEKEETVGAEGELSDSKKMSIDSQKKDIQKLKTELQDSQRQGLVEDHASVQEALTKSKKHARETKEEDILTKPGDVSEIKKTSEKDGAVRKPGVIAEPKKSSLGSEKDDTETTQADQQRAKEAIYKKDLVEAGEESFEKKTKSLESGEDDRLTKQRDVTDQLKIIPGLKKESLAPTEKRETLLTRDEDSHSMSKEKAMKLLTESLFQTQKFPVTEQGEDERSLRQEPYPTDVGEGVLPKSRSELSQEKLAEAKKEILLTKQIEQINLEKELLLKQQHELDLQYKELTKQEIDLMTSLHVQSSHDLFTEKKHQKAQETKEKEIVVEPPSVTPTQVKRKKKRKGGADDLEKGDTHKRTTALAGGRGKQPKSTAAIKYKPGENLIERFQLDPRVIQAREKNLLLPIENRFDFEGWDLQAPFTELKYLKPLNLYPKPVTLLQTTKGLLDLLDIKKTHSEIVFAAESVDRTPCPRQDAIEYAEKFGLNELFEYMLFNLIYTKPENPLDFLIHMTREITEQMKIRFQASLRLDQPSLSDISLDDSEPRDKSGMSSMDFSRSRSKMNVGKSEESSGSNSN